ncbi:MAG: DUF1175 family protein [Vicinamibacterales bacterium]
MSHAYPSRTALAALLSCLFAVGVHLEADGPIRLPHESDRAAARAWFLLLAEAQFYRSTPDVTDCAGLVRHALREALRPHTSEWLRTMRLPFPQRAPELGDRPRLSGSQFPLFLVRQHPSAWAEFADARTIVRLNAQGLGRDVALARPGDLLYYRGDTAYPSDHLMVFLGPSILPEAGRDWLVYHTGPAGGRPGEMRKVPVSTLLKHPVARWRPETSNPAFAGIFRLRIFQ